jgi:hypothetical protein
VANAIDYASFHRRVGQSVGPLVLGPGNVFQVDARKLVTQFARFLVQAPQFSVVDPVVGRAAQIGIQALAAIVAAGIWVPGLAYAASIPLGDPSFEVYNVTPYDGGFAYAQPIYGYAGAYINDIQQLDFKSNNYAVDFYVWFRWKDAISIPPRPWSS